MEEKSDLNNETKITNTTSNNHQIYGRKQLSAAINALRTVFPSVSVYACRFHFDQVIWRHIQCLTLTNRHAVKSAAGCIYSMVLHFWILMMLQTPLRLTSWIVHRHLTKLTNLLTTFVQRMSKLQHFLLRFGLKFHLIYIERIMDQNHFTDNSVVISYPIILSSRYFGMLLFGSKL